MRQGTTAPFEVTIPIGIELLKNLKATWKQDNKIILEKYLSDFKVQGNVATYTLTQEETFLFTAGIRMRVQVRALTRDGDVISSDPVYDDVYECLDREVLE